MIKFMLFHGAAEQSAVLFIPENYVVLIPENYVVHTISKINVEKSCIIYSRGVIAFRNYLECGHYVISKEKRTNQCSINNGG